MTKNLRSLWLCLVCLLLCGATSAQGLRLKTENSNNTLPFRAATSMTQTGVPTAARAAPPSNSTTNISPIVTTGADYIIAIVNSEPVTRNELQARILRVEKQLAGQNAAKPPKQDLEREVMEDLINEKIQLQLARQNNIKIDSKALDAAMQSVASQNKLSLAELKARAQAEGMDFEQLRSDIQTQLLLQKLKEREVPSNTAISDGEISAYLREQLPEAAQAASGGMNIDLAQILVVVPDDATNAQIQTAQERANRLLARARAGEDFVKLVQENSDARDAAAGGRMGMRSVERYPTLFVEATQKLNANDISDVIRSGAGFHILKVWGKEQTNSSSNGGGITIAQTKVRHILLRTGSQLSEAAAKAKLTELKRRIESNTVDFATLAKENSQDGSAAEGGLLGWANPGQFVPEFEAAMNALAIGKVSDPITSRFGVHLILVDDRRDSPLSVDEQRTLARNLLREKKLDENYTKWLRELRNNAYVEFREPPQ